MESSFLTRDQALSFWSWGTDSKTLDYQRTNPREYQIMRTHTHKKTLEYKTQHHPTTSSTLCRTPHLNTKQNKNTNSIISRQDYHLSLAHQRKNKQTNKQKLSTNLALYKVYTSHWTNLAAAAAAAAKSLQSCLTLCDPRDGSPPGSPVLGILQARTLEWVAISFSNA